ncbi:hypothetical protein FGO68_gene4814 [Halteria grandinella]|uniref:Uncharacterized protein n=1 Tax=Halteria grandinella TaxID=5974 RepID=A0A8J8NSK9_HALGN|nr:hypothetical protein FGO68_gene4814 [Halteria grandinella]
MAHPLQMLWSYGFTGWSGPNIVNPHATIEMPFLNIKSQFTELQRKLCEGVQCTERLMSQLNEQGASESVLIYKISQAKPINTIMLNYLRVATAKGAILELRGWKDISAVEYQQRLRNQEVIEYEIEFLALIDAIQNLKNVLSERPTTLKQDLDTMNYLRKSSTFPEDDSKRRKVLALQAAISSKQTVQKSISAHLERGIHLLFGWVLEQNI